MAVTPIGGTGMDWSAVAATDPTSPQSRMQSVLSSVGNLFGMSPDQLQNQLSSGQSLSSVASSKGVSRDDLLSAIKSGLQTANAATPANLDQIATRMADRVHHGHHGHHGGHAAEAASTATASTATQADSASAVSPSLDCQL